jgi:hypothetical protein
MTYPASTACLLCTDCSKLASLAHRKRAGSDVETIFNGIFQQFFGSGTAFLLSSGTTLLLPASRWMWLVGVPVNFLVSIGYVSAS